MMDPDPFTAELDLEPFRPFAYSHDAAVHFQDPRGTHWLVLDSIYTGQQGVTVHVVRPADLTPLDGVGGGMDNWANYLVKAIRERDASAAALFSYWPDNPYDVIRRVVFTRAEEELSIQDESAPVTAATTRTQHSRRERTHYRRELRHYGFDDVSNMLGTPVPKETPTEVAARANRLSDWGKLDSEVRRANRVAIPWKCRLRLHDWENRENPETHAHYKVCRCCNAHMERGDTASGTRTSWGGGY